VSRENQKFLGDFLEVSWKNLEVFSNESESVHGKPEVFLENPGVSRENRNSWLKPEPGKGKIRKCSRKT